MHIDPQGQKIQRMVFVPHGISQLEQSTESNKEKKAILVFFFFLLHYWFKNKIVIKFFANNVYIVLVYLKY